VNIRESQKRTRILMVDDDRDYAEGIRLVLEKAGYAFYYAPDCKTGLVKVKKVSPDLIILDVVMHRKTEGFLFAEKLRDAGEFSHFSCVPILVLTGMRRQGRYSFLSPVQRAVFLRSDAFLEKPVKPAVLIQTVMDLIAAVPSKPSEPKD